MENAAQEAELERLQLKQKAEAKKTSLCLTHEVKNALPAMIEIFKVLDKAHVANFSLPLPRTIAASSHERRSSMCP